MNFNEDQILSYLASFTWPLFRISSMFMALPVISVQAVPAKIKIMLSLLIVMALTPMLPAMPEIDVFSAEGVVIAAQQVLLGIIGAFILQIVFSFMLFAGQAVAYSMGLGFASMVDPATGVQVPVVAQLYVICSSLMFLAVDGHLLLIEMLAQSFTTLPVGPMGLQRDDLWRVVLWSSQIFVSGLLLSLPVMATILFINISFGVASKAAPQLQIFGVGFPITILLGMFLIWISLPVTLDVFGGMLQDSFELISQLLRLQ